MSESVKEPEQNPGPAEKVGYRQPPKDTRFTKGVSGNPKGRPKGSLNLSTILMKALHERVVINENGRRKTVTKFEAALKQLVNKAASGDLRALFHLTELAREAEAKRAANETQSESLNELDRQVMQSILDRFRADASEGQQSEAEGDTDDAKR